MELWVLLEGIKMTRSWITWIFEDGYNEVHFYNDIVKDIDLHTYITNKGNIDSHLIQSYGMGVRSI